MTEKGGYDFQYVDIHNWWQLDKRYSKSGIYIICFKHKKYLGKTVNFARRLKEHFKDCFTAKDWHKEARTEFTQRKLPKYPVGCYGSFDPRDQQKLKDYYTEYAKVLKDFFDNTHIYFWELPESEIHEAEKRCLREISRNKKQDCYYNTAYPKEVSFDELV